MADTNIVIKIKQLINEYDNIYILSNQKNIYASFLYNSPRSTEKKLLLLVAGLEKECISECGIDIQSISYEEYDKIKNLYYLYEFSDCIHFLDVQAQYGSLDNYIINGLLTEDEAVMVLLK